MNDNDNADNQRLGNALTKARLKQDLTQEAIADMLKLSVNKIAEMESFSQLAGLSMFDRGYVRSYADKVSLDLTPFEMADTQLAGLATELKPIAKIDWSKPVLPWLKLSLWAGVIASIIASAFILF